MLKWNSGVPWKILNSHQWKYYYISLCCNSGHCRYIFVFTDKHGSHLNSLQASIKVYKALYLLHEVYTIIV
jgi:hypothetical protein